MSRLITELTEIFWTVPLYDAQSLKTVVLQCLQAYIFFVNARQVMIIRTTLSKWVVCSDLSFLLKMFYSKQGQEVIPALVFPFSHDIIQSNR